MIREPAAAIAGALQTGALETGALETGALESGALGPPPSNVFPGISRVSANSGNGHASIRPNTGSSGYKTLQAELRSASHPGPGADRSSVRTPDARPLEDRARHTHWSVAIDDRCTACGACLSTCPERALLPAARRPVVVEARCSGCGECVEICPRGAITDVSIP
jgi:Pyruvate/2-oxoacid:ferredoxin oxidoreductase delta subunit